MLRTRPPLALVVAAAVPLIAGLVLAPPAATGGAGPAAVVAHAPADVPKVDVEDVLPHVRKLQSIADANGGNRSAGTTGYAQSVDYVATTLSDAGFEVERRRCTTCTESNDESVIADWPGGDTGATVMFGAHLDSVQKGPGIDDNGSGSAALLQAALTLAESKPDLAGHVRFAWWADEEQDSDASSSYVHEVGTDGLAGYLNFDMVASPNPGYFLTYPDGKLAEALAAPLGAVGKAPEEMDADCDCSDDAAFDEAGVPTTYFSTTSNDTDDMSEEQADKWGGEAGEPFDGCYHSACDSFPGNIDEDALGYSTDAVVQALWTLAVRP